MDAFNYLSVMVSMIVGLGLTQLFAGIGNLVQVRHRVKRYALHTLWIALLIALHIHMWWSLWALRAVSDWNYGGFVYVLFGPAALVIASHIIIPELLAPRIDNERHYFDTSRLFFGTLAAAAVWAMLLEPVMGLRPLFTAFRIPQAVGVLLLVGCATSKSKRFHAVATALIILLVLGGIALTRFRLRQMGIQ
jgi:hypothetical protein